jgi:hypothetical protein
MTNRNITKPVTAMMYFLPSDELKMFETMFIQDDWQAGLAQRRVIGESNGKSRDVNKH